MAYEPIPAQSRQMIEFALSDAATSAALNIGLFVLLCALVWTAYKAISS